MDAHVGIVTDAELQGNMQTVNGKFFDTEAPASWALLWFVVAVLILFVL